MNGFCAGGRGILSQLELHVYVSGGPGWCLTNKLPCGTGGEEWWGWWGFPADVRRLTSGGRIIYQWPRWCGIFRRIWASAYV